MPFTHILTVPIFTNLVKIFPIGIRGATECGDFTFIGCYALHNDFCSSYEIKNYLHCRRLPFLECDLGFVGNGHICQGKVGQKDKTNGQYQ